jgi:proteasome lid subunit RPN8/RPN11
MVGFVLPSEMASGIIAHARAGYPNEVCGIISARDNQAVALYQGRNVSSTPRVAFELDLDTLTRQLDFEKAGLTLGAIYHSHPCGSATPSPTDIKRSYNPQSVSIICSLSDPQNPSLRAFRIAGGGVLNIGLVISDISGL